MTGRGPTGTFSIVAADVDKGFWGVAVSSHPISVGSGVTWAEWRVGAVASQAFVNWEYGPRALALLSNGVPAQDVVRRVTRADRRSAQRQLAVVDRKGRAFAWTGAECQPTAFHLVGEGYSCQGNIVASEALIRSMARTFERTRGSLGGRMLAALQAAQRAGGDRRGIQSAALLVVHREPWFEPTWGDRWTDLRVDQHRQPIRELGRLLRIDESLTRGFLRARAARLRRRRAARGH